jgi:hypothetical protein
MWSVFVWRRAVPTGSNKCMGFYNQITKLNKATQRKGWWLLGLPLSPLPRLLMHYILTSLACETSPKRLSLAKVINIVVLWTQQKREMWKWNSSRETWKFFPWYQNISPPLVAVHLLGRRSLPGWNRSGPCQVWLTLATDHSSTYCSRAQYRCPRERGCSDEQLPTYSITLNKVVKTLGAREFRRWRDHTSLVGLQHDHIPCTRHMAHLLQSVIT